VAGELARPPPPTGPASVAAAAAAAATKVIGNTQHLWLVPLSLSLSLSPSASNRAGRGLALGSPAAKPLLLQLRPVQLRQSARFAQIVSQTRINSSFVTTFRVSF